MLVSGVRKWPKMQLLGVILAAVYFYIYSGGPVSALYGGIVSFVNTVLISRHIKRQDRGDSISAQASVGMMVASVVMRMAVLVVLTLTGLLVFKLNAGELILGLVLGQVGYLIDKVKQI